MAKIPNVKVPNISEEQYWQNQIREKLEPMPIRCHDCAITTGFYVPMAEMLSKQPVDIQDAVIDSWFCHNNCSKSCKGAREFIINCR